MTTRSRTITRPTTSRTSATRRALATGAAVALALTLSACGQETTTPTGATASTSSSTADPSSTSAAGLVLDDGWVKAVDAAMAGMEPMTAMFGTLRNTSDHEVTVTGGSSPAAGMVELHETVRTDSGGMQMQPKAGGIVIPAGGSHLLEPGADHVMLMKLTGPLETGTTATVTLTTSDGDVALTVPVRTFTGAEESYVPSPTHS